MSQLRNIFGVSAVAIEEMAFLYQLFEFVVSMAVVIARAQFYELIADRGSWDNYDWNLVLYAEAYFINDVKDGIGD